MWPDQIQFIMPDFVTTAPQAKLKSKVGKKTESAAKKWVVALFVHKLLSWTPFKTCWKQLRRPRMKMDSSLLVMCNCFHVFNIMNGTLCEVHAYLIYTYLPTQDMHECIETYTISRFTNWLQWKSRNRKKEWINFLCIILQLANYWFTMMKEHHRYTYLFQHRNDIVFWKWPSNSQQSIFCQVARNVSLLFCFSPVQEWIINDQKPQNVSTELSCYRDG